MGECPIYWSLVWHTHNSHIYWSEWSLIYNTILKSFVYILKILAGWYESSISIGSMDEFCVGMKIVHSISIEKHIWVWKGGDLEDFNNITMQFCTCFISFEWVHTIDFLSAECYQSLQNRTNLHKRSTVEKSDLSCGNNIWIKSLINWYLISNWSIP